MDQCVQCVDVSFLDHAGWQQVPLQMLPLDRSMRWSALRRIFFGVNDPKPCHVFCKEDGSLQTSATSNQQTNATSKNLAMPKFQLSVAVRRGEAPSSHQGTGSIWKLFVHFVVASRCIGGSVTWDETGRYLHQPLGSEEMHLS